MRYGGLLVAMALLVSVMMLGCSKDLTSDTAFEVNSPAAATPVVGTAAAPPTVSELTRPDPPLPIDGRATCTERSELTVFGPITSRLGYALAPGKLPEGFGITRVGYSGGTAQISYDRAGRQLLIVAYPVDFTPEDDRLKQGIGLVRPNDAIDQVQVSGEAAHFMRGGWSDATIMAGPGIDPADAEWDYEKSLGIFFDCVTLEGATITVAVQARPGPVTWISTEEMIEIAESFTLIE